MLLVALAAAALVLPACNTGEFRSTGDIAVLTDFMVGSFSSAKQAEKDPENFRDIRLEMARIWPDRDDGVWLYVEQAVATSLARPYRQRVYRLTANADARCGPMSTRCRSNSRREQARAGQTLRPDTAATELKVAAPSRSPGIRQFALHRRPPAPAASTLQGAAYATSEGASMPTAHHLDRGFDRRTRCGARPRAATPKQSGPRN